MTKGLCTLCAQTTERVRYFPRQLITADDMRAEQAWVQAKLRRHNRVLHGFGVVCGLSVRAPVEGDQPRQVLICPGYAVTPQGDEVMVDEAVQLDLGTGATDPEPCGDPWPCPPRGPMPGADDQFVYVAIRYAECLSRPVRVHPAGCGCDTSGCESSRIRESFELAVLWELPDSHGAAAEADGKWRAALEARQPEASLPVPGCPECTDDPWVVIAMVRLPGDPATAITDADITYTDRRALWSTQALMSIMP